MSENEFESYTLPKEIQDSYMEISNHLRYKSRFSLPKLHASLVDDFVKRQIEHGLKTIEKDVSFFRARIGEPGILDLFTLDDMGAPPPGKAGSGRINPEGISYLYLADSPATAIAEVRPWKRARISVATLKTVRPLKIVSLLAGDSLGNEVTEKDIEKVEVQREVKRMMNGIILKALYFAFPAHHNDKHAYLASQYIAELFKESGVDGLEYSSVLNEGGINTALFDVSSASCIKVDGYLIQGVEYKYDELS